MKQSITFILNGYGPNPIGGFKIIYEYASRLSQRGWKVNVVHPWNLKKDVTSSILKRIENRLRFIRHKILGLYLPRKWFKIGKKVRMMCVPDLSENNIPNADYIVACPVESASYVNEYSRKKGRKFYFIQHFEDWVFNKERVEETWKYPLNKIVISKWLQKIANNLGEKATYIPNGLDFSFFRVITPFEKRLMKSICFMSHELSWKGTKYVFDAIGLLKLKYPELVVKTFSAYQKPDKNPEYIEYYFRPSQEKIREIYNSSSIFISPSLSEGWPLPPAEAMMCGCVVIATDIGGHKEYIEDNQNGLLCKPASAVSIVEKVEYLFNHQDVALKISHRAPQSLTKFDWDSRVDLFEKALLECDSTGHNDN
jgi:glycosyltransferase involved in cell wall biosynthesis